MAIFSSFSGFERLNTMDFFFAEIFLFGSIGETMTNQNSRRSHDAFFRWLFADENHLRALLKLSAKSNLEIQQFLAAVDPNTFVRIPDSYSNVDETGEADLAFRVNAISGDHALVGVLLEHKSGPDANSDRRHSFLQRKSSVGPVQKFSAVSRIFPQSYFAVQSGVCEYDANFGR